MKQMLSSLAVIRWLYFCHISQSIHTRVYFGIKLFSKDRRTNDISSGIKMEWWRWTIPTVVQKFVGMKLTLQLFLNKFEPVEW